MIGPHGHARSLGARPPLTAADNSAFRPGGTPHGAKRPSVDLDGVPRRDAENLARLASAMRELNARVRVEGLDDDQAAKLPVVLDAHTLARAELSTWRTDASPGPSPAAGRALPHRFAGLG